MIKINRSYLDRFKKSTYGYLFPIRRGAYLSFDKHSLEYLGIQMYYNSIYYPMSEGDKTLARLLSLGYIELYND